MTHFYLSASRPRFQAGLRMYCRAIQYSAIL